MNLVADSFRLYRERFLSILLLSFTIVFPVLIVHAVLVNFVYGVTAWLDGGIVGNLTNALLLLFFFVIVQVPFILFTQYEQEGSEHPLRSTYFTFTQRGFPAYLFAVVYCVVVAAGFAFLIIPGLIIMILLFLTPYVSILREKPFRQSWRIALKLGKKHFFRLFTLLVVTSLIELVIEVGIMYGMSFITTNYLAILFTQMVLNTILFPLVIIIITMHVMDWKQKTWL